MRLRLAVLACVSTALLATVIPTVVTAAPRPNRGLTINATPNPILAGEGVLIYGQLNMAPINGQTIILYHHLAGSHRGYTRVASTTTDSHGFYSFTRAEDVVMTSRSWFVREAGSRVHSRTIRERVAALVTLSASPTSTDTNHRVYFSGHVAPNHAFERVLLQEQRGSSDDWRTLKSGVLGPGSNYLFSYRWRRPGERDVRVVFPGDARNIRGASDPVSVTVEQAQVPGFTINSSSPITDAGDSVTISGVLDQPGTTTPQSNTAVTLYARTASQSKLRPVADTTTRSDGSYSFTQSPTENTVYQVRTTLAPHRHTALLFEGVRDVVAMTASSITSTVGGTVTFTGTVNPDKTGHVIYLQRLGSDHDWHTVEINTVGPGSSFQFAWAFGKAGTYNFRARITSDRRNVGAASGAVKVTVSGSSPSSLPPAS
jgi:hypothetical protein